MSYEVSHWQVVFVKTKRRKIDLFGKCIAESTLYFLLDPQF